MAYLGQAAMRVMLWTVTPSHYQLAFHEALRAAGVDLVVRYFGTVPPQRVDMGWEAAPALTPSDCYVAPGVAALRGVPDWRQRVHVIPGYSTAFCRTLVRLLSREGVRWVHWSERSHPGLRWLLSLPLKRWYGALVNRHALGAFAIGSVARDDFLRWGISGDRIVELAYCVEPHSAAEPSRVATEFAAGRFVFGFAGELCPRKGVDLLLRAVAYTGRADEKVGLLIMGDGRGRHRLKGLTRHLGLEDRVHFCGAVPWRLVQGEMRACDAFVLPSRFDGWGVVLNEAAEVGLPLIASDAVGAAHDLIIPGWNGFRFASGVVSELAAAIQSYAETPGLAARHGRRSREIVMGFSPERQAERFCRTLEAWQRRPCPEQPMTRSVEGGQ